MHLSDVHSPAPATGTPWAAVAHGVAIAPTAHAVCLVRLPLHAGDRITYTHGVDCCPGACPTARRAYVSALGTWTEPLRAASNAALRERGNAAHGGLTRILLAKQIRDDTRLAALARSVPARRRARSPTGGSTTHCSHAGFSRRALTRARPRTTCARRRTASSSASTSPSAASAHATRATASSRASTGPTRSCTCVCVAITRVSPVFALHCASLADPTNDARALKMTHGVNDGEAPNFADDSTLYTVLQLCTGVGPSEGFQHLQADLLPASASAIDRRAAPQLRRDQGLARVTVAWMQCLFHDWLGVSDERPQDTPRYHLALLVARHIKSVVYARRSFLSRAAGFSARDRDDPAPPPQAPPGTNKLIKLNKPEVSPYLHLQSATLEGAIRACQARARLTAVSAVHRRRRADSGALFSNWRSAFSSLVLALVRVREESRRAS